MYNEWMYCVKLLHKAMQAALSKPLSVLKCWPVASHPPLVSCPHISQLSPKFVEKSTEVSEFNGVFPISPRLRRGPTDLERWASFGTGPGAGGGEWWAGNHLVRQRINGPRVAQGSRSTTSRRHSGRNLQQDNYSPFLLLQCRELDMCYKATAHTGPDSD